MHTVIGQSVDVLFNFSAYLGNVWLSCSLFFGIGILSRNKPLNKTLKESHKRGSLYLACRF